jgi:hypothetical protein
MSLTSGVGRASKDLARWFKAPAHPKIFMDTSANCDDTALVKMEEGDARTEDIRVQHTISIQRT